MGLPSISPKRFWAKVDKSAGIDGCWLWQGARTDGGYGMYAYCRRLRQRAHRIAYVLGIGSIPEGLELDHLCRTRLCCNPAHLEAVTHRVNVQRGESGKYLRERTHCPKGHAYDEANAVLRYGRRYCRTCQNAQRRQPAAGSSSSGRGTQAGAAA